MNNSTNSQFVSSILAKEGLVVGLKTVDKIVNLLQMERKFVVTKNDVLEMTNFVLVDELAAEFDQRFLIEMNKPLDF